MSDAAVPSTEQVQSYLAQHSLEAVIEDAVNEAVLRLAKAPREPNAPPPPSPRPGWHQASGPAQDPFEFIGNKLLQKSAQLAGEGERDLGRARASSASAPLHACLSLCFCARPRSY